ncbi:MAG: sulfate adenylyltransferase subunit CysN [Acidobacteriaceae bacterium]
MATSNVEFGLPSFAAGGVLSPAKELLRFTTAGSVDDGKSTLIGRLLYDSQAVYEDQLAAVRKSRINRSSGPLDFSLLTDGLRAEREQGITIDVAYRYFSTPRRKFIIADTPGHEQYTRNMATGASTADAAVVLIDAMKGVQTQSRRHAYIASLLGTRHVVAAVNKMDLVSYSEDVFRQISHEVAELSEKLAISDVYVVPISALKGDNVVHRSSRMPWFEGPPLLEYLEELDVEDFLASSPLRFPVQYVVRPNATFRGFAGQIESGVLEVGNLVTALPSGVRTRIRSIVTFDGEADRAAGGDAVTVTLDDEVDLGRGDLLIGDKEPPTVSRNFVAHLVWLNSDPLDIARFYVLKHTTRTVRARVAKIQHRVDVNSMAHVPSQTLEMNDIASVELTASLPLFFDPYEQIRAMGSFILIDPVTNATVAAGMIQEAINTETVDSPQGVRVSFAERQLLHGHAPAAVLLPDRLGAAVMLERRLFNEGWNVQLIPDGLTIPQMEAVMQIMHEAGVIAVFSTVGDLQQLEQAVARRFPPESIFVSKSQDVSDPDLAAALLEELRAWRNHSTRTREREQ